jgi:hypothetical protein
LGLLANRLRSQDHHIYPITLSVLPSDADDISSTGLSTHAIDALIMLDSANLQNVILFVTLFRTLLPVWQPITPDRILHTVFIEALNDEQKSCCKNALSDIRRRTKSNR